MKGYNFKRPDGKLADCSPCRFCKYKEEMTVSPHCYNCIDHVYLALHRPNVETEFACFEAESKERLRELLTLQCTDLTL